MYADITYEEILARILDRVPGGIDKREGSIIYDAVAPCAIEIRQMYLELDNIIMQAFADTASREYLIKKCEEVGITPHAATHAILRAEFTPASVSIPVGARFSCEQLNYAVIAKIEDGIYEVECETIGAAGNELVGRLIPIDFIEGLETAELTEILVPGQDEESTESLRERYFNHFKSAAFGGNVADYIEKTTGINGVGAVKVEPVWNGGGTVKLTILNSEYDTASDVLVDLVQETIDPTKDASGQGLAPIGHVVTVVSANAVVVDVESTITTAATTSFEQLKAEIESAVRAYLFKLRQDWSKEERTTVRISQVETRILQVDGVLDVENTKLNGLAENLELDKNEVPLLGGVTNG